MRHPLHLDPFTTGNLDYVDSTDHLGHSWREGKCRLCSIHLRDASTDHRCGDVYFVPRQATFCAYCGRALEPDGCPCRMVNAIAP